MERYSGSCELLSEVHGLEQLRQWISAIPYSDWPQQPPYAGEMRPAMVTSPEWFDFSNRTNNFIQANPNLVPQGYYPFYFMLSVIMPGHFIGSHIDIRGAEWLHRVHVPIFTNPESCIFIDRAYHLSAGYAYKINPERRHAIMNHGDTPRVHLIFDIINKTLVG